jgi:hypothetical protein
MMQATGAEAFTRPRFRQDHLLAEAFEDSGSKFVDVMDPDTNLAPRFRCVVCPASDLRQPLISLATLWMMMHYVERSAGSVISEFWKRNDIVTRRTCV